MSIFKRATDVIRANLSSLIDSAEDPEKMIDLFLEDAREQLAEAKRAVHEAIASSKEIEQQVQEYGEQVERWGKRAEEAVVKDRDDLAAKALAERQRYTQLRQKLLDPLEASKKNVEQAKGRLAELEQKIEEAENRRAELKARARVARAEMKVSKGLAGIDKADALGDMDRMEEKVKRMEAQAAAASEMADEEKKTDLEEEFAKLGQGSVNDELAALKKKLGKG
ncbi:PspA/IM30 family protein [bacterium]|nr:PspA/IM30 family protein [bacterium]